MELLAAISGIESTPTGEDIVVHSDYSKLVSMMTTGAAKGWERSSEFELWARLDTAVSQRVVAWRLVRGHSGDRWNIAAHQLSRKAARGDA